MVTWTWLSYIPAAIAVAKTAFNHDKTPLFLMVTFSILLNIAQAKAELLSLQPPQQQLKRYELKGIDCDRPTNVRSFKLPQDCKDSDILEKTPEISTFQILQKTEYHTTDYCEVSKSSTVYECSAWSHNRMLRSEVAHPFPVTAI